jgi:hypothetical protein
MAKCRSLIRMSSSHRNMLATNQSAKAKQPIWKALGGGSYNHAWVSNFSEPKQLIPPNSYQGKWVLKYPIETGNKITDAMNAPPRAIRIWEEINPKHPVGLHKRGWVAPYIGDSKPSTDDQIASKLIEIYTKTKRIIVDAPTEGNFLTNTKTGEVTLVDVDLALKRSTSMASLDFARDLDNKFEQYWKNESTNNMALTVTIIKNLLFLEDSLENDAIDKLIKQNLITFEVIEALSYFRINERPLSLSLLLQLNNMASLDIPLDDVLCKSLSDSSLNVKSSDGFFKSNQSLQFFQQIAKQTTPEVFSDSRSPVRLS